MWVCRTVEAIMQPITKHEIKQFENDWHTIEHETSPNFTIKTTLDYQFSFNYCVAFRDPNLPEWIVARWYWNDEWLRFADGIWYDQ